MSSAPPSKDTNESATANKKRKIDENVILSEINLCAEPSVQNCSKERAVEATPIEQSTSLKRFQYVNNNDFKYLNVQLPSGRDIKLKMYTKDSEILNYVNMKTFVFKLKKTGF